MEQQVYLAPGAHVVGDVRLGRQGSLWYGAVLRGDRGPITVGDGTNIQDNAVLHDATTVGRGCTIGHCAVVHGCTVGDGCTVGMGAIVLNGAVLGENCMVGAGAVVTGKMRAPAGSLLVGNPARVVRPLRPEEIAAMQAGCLRYQQEAQSLPLAAVGQAL